MDKNAYKIGLLMVFILLISLFVRLEYRRLLVVDNPLRGDAFYYLSCAYNIFEYGIFSKEPTFNSDKIPEPDSFWAPGFPFLLSSAIQVGGISNYGFYPVGTLYNSLLGAFLAPMIFYICIQFLPITWSVAASLLTAFSPHLLSIGGNLVTETLFSFLVFSSIVCLIIGLKKNSAFHYALSGFLSGLANLTNPVILFFPFLAAYYLYRRFRYSETPKSSIIYIAAYLLCFVFITGCWEMRNYISVNKKSQTATGRAAVNIINGLYPDYHNAYATGFSKSPEYSMNKDIKRADGSFYKAVTIAAEKILNKPDEYLLWYFIKKPVLFWSWDIHIGNGDIYQYPVIQSLFTVSPLWKSIKLLFQYINPVFLITNIVGLFLFLCMKNKMTIKNNHYLLFNVILIVYSTVIYSIFYPDPRYSIPFRPAFYIFFIWTLTKISGALKMSKNVKKTDNE